MSKATNDYVALYKAQLQKGDIQVAYRRLMKCVMAIRAHFANTAVYQVGNVSPGYLDYTYFSFFDDALRAKKLRFGIVLNHQEMRFELWLMGQNAAVQKQYWAALKDTRWNKDRDEMPRYSVLEAVLVETPDFNDPEALTAKIETAALKLAKEIAAHVL